MSIAVHIHATDPRVLAEVIADSMRAEDGVVIDQPAVGHLAALVEAEERQSAARAIEWHWLNASGRIDPDNDWSDI